MLYKFKCKAAADLIMLGEQGDELLRVVGREPSAQGIFEVAAMPAAIAALEAAVARSEQAPSAVADKGEDEDRAGARAVSLRQRAWPLRELLRRAHEAQQVVVWGV
jgi:GAF domain-containing protein